MTESLTFLSYFNGIKETFRNDLKIFSSTVRPTGPVVRPKETQIVT